MTLEQELKQAEEQAEALRRKLTLETACKLTSLLQEAAAAEEAVIAAGKVLDSADAEWRAHGDEHGYMYKSRIDLTKVWKLEKIDRAEFDALQEASRAAAAVLADAQRRNNAAFNALQEPLKAANEMARRVELLRAFRIHSPCC